MLGVPIKWHDHKVAETLNELNCSLCEKNSGLDGCQRGMQGAKRDSLRRTTTTTPNHCASNRLEHACTLLLSTTLLTSHTSDSE